MRTILNKELRLPNGAHSAPYIAFTTSSSGRGLGREDKTVEFVGLRYANPGYIIFAHLPVKPQDSSSSRVICPLLPGCAADSPSNKRSR